MRLILALPLALAACAQPEPITDYDAPYLGKGLQSSPIPQPRPERWTAPHLRRHPTPVPNLPWCDDGERAERPEPPVVHPEPPKPEKPKHPKERGLS